MKKKHLFQNKKEWQALIELYQTNGGMIIYQLQDIAPESYPCVASIVEEVGSDTAYLQVQYIYLTDFVSTPHNN